MISGFNTDIEFQGTVYHVQTEDKGLQKRMIMSLVYDRGTILASKRASYDDLEPGSFDEKELSARLSRQHKLICAAVKAGRIGELKEMTAKSAANGARSKTEAVTMVLETADAPVAMPMAVPRPPIKIAMIETEEFAHIVSPELFEEELVIDAVHVIEDEEILPAEAVAVVSELSGQERPPNTKLSLELLGDTNFKGGDRRTVNIMICRGSDRKVVPGAQIMIKVLGSSFRPVIFHAKTNPNGRASMHRQFPHFHAGRAAILIRAMTDGEEIELRRAVTPG